MRNEPNSVLQSYQHRRRRSSYYIRMRAIINEKEVEGVFRFAEPRLGLRG